MRSYSNFNFESAVVSLINLPFWTFERISAKFQMTIKCTNLRVWICPFELKLISYRYVTVPKQSPLSFNLPELAYAGTLYPPRSFSLFWNPGAYRVKRCQLRISWKVRNETEPYVLLLKPLFLGRVMIDIIHRKLNSEVVLIGRP